MESSDLFSSFPGGPRHVLVTGGTGFIGRQLVAGLRAGGHQVTVWTRKAPRGQAVEGLRYCQSLDDVSADAAIDTVINLAGARILGLPWTASRREALLRSRVGLTQRLVAWMAKTAHQPAVLLSASAIGYYGVQPPGDDTALTEDNAPQPIFMSQLCQAWEAAAAEATGLGVKVVCLRFGLVLGHGGALPMLLLPVRLGLGGRLGTGRQWMSWVHLDDLLRALAHAWRASEKADAAPLTCYNVTAPQQVRQLDFSQTAAAILHRPCRLPTPAWPLRLLLGEQADLLLEGQRVQPARLLGEGFAFRYPTLDGALGDLINPAATPC